MTPPPARVTAVRDGTTVTMTIDIRIVSMDGITTPVVMDVAPYAHDNRTTYPSALPPRPSAASWGGTPTTGL